MSHYTQCYLLLFLLFVSSFCIYSSILKLVLFLIGWTSIGGLTWLDLVYHTFKRDCRLLYRMSLILMNAIRYKVQGTTLLTLFSNHVQQSPNKTIFINGETEEKWSFKKADEYSNRICQYFISLGYKKGDCIALFMTNKPEYVFIWLGLAKAGIITALINFNLMNESLLHTIKAAKASAIIYDTETETGICSIYQELEKESIKFGFYGLFNASKVPKSISLKSVLHDFSPDFSSLITIYPHDILFYVYTSGTTGLPKAVIIKHDRHLLLCMSVSSFTSLVKNDIMYSYLPLYHLSGAQVGICNSLINGGTTVIKKRFSSSTFWKDVVKYNVTVINYIGEICRFLLNSPSCPEEKTHSVRFMMGNGLRSEIWDAFTARFSIPKIYEFYGSTEGNCTLINLENKIGIIGYLPVILPKIILNKILPLRIIKIDQDTGEPIKDSTGCTIECEAGEPGEFIGQIVSGNALKEFKGYTNSSENNAKILKDVFQKGDAYFRSGDILTKDKYGYIYFVDRSGDTFRWKGENVSTAEVESVILKYLKTQTVFVYGVEIPHRDGKAGMAIIPPITTEALEHLFHSLSTELPPYAIPLFLRVTTIENLELTDTFKVKKRVLQESGFNPKLIKDSLYYLNSLTKSYQTLTEEVYFNILKGSIRF